MSALRRGCRVLDVLHEKHPGAHIPEELAFDDYANSAELLEAMPIASLAGLGPVGWMAPP
jgi:hypothetical protein